ncbi:MAG: hypothetical protein DI537_39855 [Stutzerimonas stutzeri]|nr:MAG: hypothetical protein DI537_39855 [Stutzerimonas stutzeri]
MMCNAVEQGGGHLGIPEHGRPFAEGQVGRDDDAGAFVELADQVEQELAARARERQISKLIEHHQVEPRELPSQGPALADPGLLFEACHHTILMMAVLEPRKRQFEFISAFAEHTSPGQPIRLVVAGDGKDRARLEDLVQSLRVADRVKLIGHRGDPERLVAMSDLSVLASLREGLPRTIIQSIAGNRPAVVTPLQGIEEVVADGQSGIVVPSTDVDLLARTAISVVNHPETLAKLTKGALQTNVDDWAFHSMFAQLDAAYAKTLNSPSVASRIRSANGLATSPASQDSAFIPQSRAA